MAIAVLLLIVLLFFIIRNAVKEKKTVQQRQKVQSVSQQTTETYLERLDREMKEGEEKARQWLDEKRLEHGQESARFSGWGSSSKGIVFFDEAGLLYVEGVQYRYSSVENCKLVVIYEDEDEYFEDEMEYEDELRKRRDPSNWFDCEILGDMPDEPFGTGAAVWDSESGNFISRYLPKSNGSREINHYEIKIAFKEESEYVVFELPSSDELNAERTFKHLLRIKARNQKQTAHASTEENPADKLLRVAELKERGLITEEEFDKVKAKLLS